MTIYHDGMMFHYCCVSLVSVVKDQTAPRLCVGWRGSLMIMSMMLMMDQGDWHGDLGASYHHHSDDSW